MVIGTEPPGITEQYILPQDQWSAHSRFCWSKSNLSSNSVESGSTEKSVRRKCQANRYTRSCIYGTTLMEHQRGEKYMFYTLWISEFPCAGTLCTLTDQQLSPFTCCSWKWDWFSPAYPRWGLGWCKSFQTLWIPHPLFRDGPWWPQFTFDTW